MTMDRLPPSFRPSPDASEIAAVDPKGMGNRIRHIPLNGGNVSEVEVSGRKGLNVLFWAADGKGWFVSSVTPSNGQNLFAHANPRGDSQVLFEQPQDALDTFGVPSHDGKRLAFLQWTNPSNVWMIDNSDGHRHRLPRDMIEMLTVVAGPMTEIRANQKASGCWSVCSGHTPSGAHRGCAEWPRRHTPADVPLRRSLRRCSPAGRARQFCLSTTRAGWRTVSRARRPWSHSGLVLLCYK